jgi:glycosyltransferase involved in cell wall biosynthesis
VRSKPGAKLLIVGERGEQCRCERLAVELGISEAVVFRGHVDDPNEVHELLSESRVFVFPSVKEGLPRAVGEAMATGLPCVLSDIPVFKELYSQMVILVPAGKPILFAEAILNLLEDKGKYDEMARRGAEAASERTWETVARRMLWVLQNT